MTTTTSKVSQLQLYFGDPFHLTDKIDIKQPTIGEVLEYDKRFGESEFWATLNIFIGNPTMYRLLLWDMGIDWNKITDFQLFSIMVKTLQVEKTEILFGDIDLASFDQYLKQSPKEEQEENDSSEPVMVMYSPQYDIEINEETYNTMALYMRTMFNMFPKVEKAKGKTTKEWIIEEDRMNMQNRQKNKDEESGTSVLLPLIESCCCHPGFKYKKNELREVGIYEFMRDVQRLQIYESTTALLKGVYSGFVDTKNIKKEEFDFMREIKPDKK